MEVRCSGVRTVVNRYHLAIFDFDGRLAAQEEFLPETGRGPPA
jgi:hypothetical protein